MRAGGYLLVDCNSFYCSAERLFKPELSHRPVIVLSNNDGCVVSRTQEAKALGIPMGAPYFEIRSMCEARGVAVFSSNYELYADLSRRVMLALAEYAEAIEIYSIDEAFLGFDQMPSKDFARGMRERVTREIGIPVSVGGGPTKTLAKMAGSMAKKTGVHLWSPEDEILWEKMPCEEIWGISKGFGRRLRERRVMTVSDFLFMPASFANECLGVVGARIWHELRGEPCLDLVSSAPRRKSLCSSRTFQSQTADLEDLESAVSEHCHRVSETLRRESSYAEVVTLFLSTDRFREGAAQHYPVGSIRLREPTIATQNVLAAAHQLLHKLRNPEVAYRKAGVVVSEISDGCQAVLWPESAERRQKLEAVCFAMDAANSAHGRRVVSLGTSKRERIWLSGASRKSQRYVSSWEELPSVH